MFRDGYEGEDTLICCRLWRGKKKTGTVLDSDRFKGSLANVFRNTLKFIERNTKTGWRKTKNGGRESIRSYPKDAIREALVNAMARRDYSIAGTQIDVDIYCDRIEIVSPGSWLLPKGYEEYAIEEMISYLEIPLSDKRNEKFVEEYRQYLIGTISELCDCVDSLDSAGQYEEERKVDAFNPQALHQMAHYQLEKIFSYLGEKSTYLSFGSNEEWGLKMADSFYKEFAHKWVTIDSVACCNGFAQTFRRITGQKYVKSDKDIYEKLNHYGDEEQAIKLADQKYNEHILNGNEKPTEMCPCTTVHRLVREIKSKVSTRN